VLGKNFGEFIKKKPRRCLLILKSIFWKSKNGLKLWPKRCGIQDGTHWKKVAVRPADIFGLNIIDFFSTQQSRKRVLRFGILMVFAKFVSPDSATKKNFGNTKKNTINKKYAVRPRTAFCFGLIGGTIYLFFQSLIIMQPLPRVTVSFCRSLQPREATISFGKVTYIVPLPVFVNFLMLLFFIRFSYVIGNVTCYVT